MKRAKMALLTIRKQLADDFNLTCVLEHDEETGQWMAHFEEFPATYGVGNTKPAAKKNLMQTLKTVLELEAAERQQQQVKTANVLRQSIAFKMAF